jgi:hypothetical protein
MEMDVKEEIMGMAMDGYDRGFKDGVEIVIEGLEVLASRGEIDPLPQGIIEGLKIVATWKSIRKTHEEISPASG